MGKLLIVNTNNSLFHYLIQLEKKSNPSFIYLFMIVIHTNKCSVEKKLINSFFLVEISTFPDNPYLRLMHLQPLQFVLHGSPEI